MLPPLVGRDAHAITCRAYPGSPDTYVSRQQVAGLVSVGLTGPHHYLLELSVDMSTTSVNRGGLGVEEALLIGALILGDRFWVVRGGRPAGVAASWRGPKRVRSAWGTCRAATKRPRPLDRPWSRPKKAEVGPSGEMLAHRPRWPSRRRLGNHQC